MLIISGLPRSGTSLLARFCHNVGYLVGGKWNHAVNAGMEEPQIVEVNEDIAAGRNLERARYYVRGCSRIVCKDPRFVWPGVLRFWAECRNDLRCLVLLRDVAAVGRSLRSHPEWFRGPPSDDDNRSMLAAFWRDIALSETPCLSLPFPEFLDRYDSVHRALTEFGGLMIDHDRGRQVWEALVNHELVHH